MARKIAFERGKAWVKEWDDELTPLEIAAALEANAELPFAIAPLLRCGQRPVGYFRDVWTEDASYYTNRKGAKSLLVAFASAKGRVGGPISYFLQMLRDDEFDVVILRDPRQLHYTHGVRGLGSFLESMGQIKRFADANSFKQVLSFGCSLAGLPALRAGRLIGARRAFSIGGRYPWHPGRLIRGETPVCAFDTLCACASSSPTELVSIYSRGNEIDAHANALLRRTFPESIEVPIDLDEHSIFTHFYRARLLSLFLACLFEYWDEAALRNDLLARLQYAARLTLFQESLDKKRLEEDRKRLEEHKKRLDKNSLEDRKRLEEHKKRLDKKHLDKTSTEARRWRKAEKDNRNLLRQLQAVHKSHSWRVTYPLRAIKRMFARGMGPLLAKLLGKYSQ